MLRTSINTHCEGGLVGIGIAINHQGQIESVKALAFHGETNQTPGVGRHEVDLIGGGELGRTDQVTFVLPAFVVDDDNTLSVANRRQCIGNAVKSDG